MNINKFMHLIELTRKTTGKDWIYNKRVLRNKLRELIDCEVKKLHKHNVSNQRELLNFLIKRNYLEADEYWIEQILLEYEIEKIL